MFTSLDLLARSFRLSVQKRRYLEYLQHADVLARQIASAALMVAQNHPPAGITFALQQVVRSMIVLSTCASQNCMSSLELTRQRAEKILLATALKLIRKAQTEGDLETRKRTTKIIKRLSKECAVFFSLVHVINIQQLDDS